jgi:hypothetical protein
VYGHPRRVEDEHASDTRELRAIYFVLADIKVAVEEILSYIRGDDDEEEEEDDRDA